MVTLALNTKSKCWMITTCCHLAPRHLPLLKSAKSSGQLGQRPERVGKAGPGQSCRCRKTPCGRSLPADPGLGGYMIYAEGSHHTCGCTGRALENLPQEGQKAPAFTQEKRQLRANWEGRPYPCQGEASHYKCDHFVKPHSEDRAGTLHLWSAAQGCSACRG